MPDRWRLAANHPQEPPGHCVLSRRPLDHRPRARGGAGGDEPHRIDPTLTQYLGSIVDVALNIALLLGILSYFGIQTTSFAAMLAGAGVVRWCASSRVDNSSRRGWPPRACTRFQASGATTTWSRPRDLAL
jgi:hypothetical protein